MEKKKQCLLEIKDNLTHELKKKKKKTTEVTCIRSRELAFLDWEVAQKSPFELRSMNG